MGVLGYLREMIGGSLDGAGRYQVGGSVAVICLSSVLAGSGEHFFGHSSYSVLVEDSAKAVDFLAGAVLIWLVLVGTPSRKLAAERTRATSLQADQAADRHQIADLQTEVANLKAQKAVPPSINIENYYAIGDLDALRKLPPAPGLPHLGLLPPATPPAPATPQAAGTQPVANPPEPPEPPKPDAESGGETSSGK